MWGRLLGVVFAVPAVYFAARGAVTRPLVGRLGLLFLMGGTQGLVGWWMVKSGLHVSPPAVACRSDAHLKRTCGVCLTEHRVAARLRSDSSLSTSAKRECFDEGRYISYTEKCATVMCRSRTSTTRRRG
jgi:Cytochrome oxidase assembly protein